MIFVHKNWVNFWNFILFWDIILTNKLVVLLFPTKITRQKNKFTDWFGLLQSLIYFIANKNLLIKNKIKK